MDEELKIIDEEIRVTTTLDACVRYVGHGYADTKQEAGGAWSEVAVSDDGHAYLITVQAVSIEPDGEVVI